jgi:hypothetical protein
MDITEVARKRAPPRWTVPPRSMRPRRHNDVFCARDLLRAACRLVYQVEQLGVFFVRRRPLAHWHVHERAEALAESVSTTRHRARRTMTRNSAEVCEVSFGEEPNILETSSREERISVAPIEHAEAFGGPFAQQIAQSVQARQNCEDDRAVRLHDTHDFG